MAVTRSASPRGIETGHRLASHDSVNATLANDGQKPKMTKVSPIAIVTGAKVLITDAERIGSIVEFKGTVL